MKNPVNEIIDNRDYALESRLLMFYICIEEIWAIVNAFATMAVGLPIETVRMYAILAIALPVYCFMGWLFKIQKVCKILFFPMVLIRTPIMWYFVGGVRAAGNILFVCEIIVFVMCLKGKAQAIYILISLASTSLTMNLYHRFEHILTFTLDPRQSAIANSILGPTTTILIAVLLLKQKSEYMKERDLAIKSEKELEKSNKLQKNFLANMSHEIRSPMGIVLGFNTLISESNDVEQIHEYSKNISHAGITLQTVINDILDYSRIESGKLDIINVDYSFRELARDINTDISFKCETKGLEYKSIIDPNIPHYLFGDDVRIRQCILNILSNAVKYTEKGIVTFEAKFDGLDEENRPKLIFIVSDTGKGIPEESLPKLFSSFQRIDEDHNRGIEGTGLGLAITKSLLDEMGGSVEVSSTVGVGSVFTLYITQQQSEVKAIVKDEEEEISLKDVNVLVVDDTKMNLVIIQKFLGKSGAIVTSVDSGQKCLDACAAKKFDIILLDHMMPQMDGVETFKKLKEQGGSNNDTPVIMLTANAMAGAKQEYMSMGFDNYLSKPVDKNNLLKTISEYVK